MTFTKQILKTDKYFLIFMLIYRFFVSLYRVCIGRYLVDMWL
jgi:hypothetical protein